MNTRLLLALFALSIFWGCSKDDSNNDNGTQFGLAPEIPNQQVLLDLINEMRAGGFTCGADNLNSVGEVTWNATLAQVAKQHSQDLNDNLNELSHIGSDNSAPRDRVNSAGYDLSNLSGLVIENLAKGFTTEQDVMNAWKDSEGHCVNLMDGRISEIGVGTSGPYWTMILASH